LRRKTDQTRTGRVVAYDEDVYAWVYLDQVEQVLRYEAYVIGYDESGRKGTLEFILEDGLVEGVDMEELEDIVMPDHGESDTDDACELLRTLDFYRPIAYLSPKCNPYIRYGRDRISKLHRFFAEQEAELKSVNRARWMRKLDALGYDVINSLSSE